MKFGKHGVFAPTETITGKPYSTHDHKKGLGQFGFSDYYVAIDFKRSVADVDGLIADILPDVQIYDTQAKIEAIHAQQIAEAEEAKAKKVVDPRIAVQKELEKELKSLESLPTGKSEPDKGKPITVKAKDSNES